MSFLVCAGETSGYSILPTTEYGSSASCQYNIFKDPKCSGLSTPLLAVGAESGSLSPGRADSALPERAPTPASTRPRKKVKMVRKAGIDPKIYGHIPDVPVLSTFLSRLECSGAGVHAPTRAGIHGSKKDGAYSIVMSGGYEDDEDRGETFIYTGEGGRGSKTSSGKNTWSGAQERDQEWTGGNLSLQLSQINGSPVRVVRGGSGFSSRYAPDKGRYRYDGLYTVTEATRAKGKTGFMTCQFTFKRLPGQPPLPGIELRPAKRRRNREADDELEPGPSKRQRHKSLSSRSSSLFRSDSDAETPPPPSASASTVASGAASTPVRFSPYLWYQNPYRRDPMVPGTFCLPGSDEEEENTEFNSTPMPTRSLNGKEPSFEYEAADELGPDDGEDELMEDNNEDLFLEDGPPERSKPTITESWSRESDNEEQPWPAERHESASSRSSSLFRSDSDVETSPRAVGRSRESDDEEQPWPAERHESASLRSSSLFRSDSDVETSPRAASRSRESDDEEQPGLAKGHESASSSSLLCSDMETLPQPSASTNGGGPPPALRQPSTTQSLLEGQQPQQPDIAQPSREHLEATTLHIAKLKADYSPERMLPNVPAIDVPAEQRKEYNNVLEQLHRGCTDLDQNLPMIFALIKNEVIVRRLIVIVQTAIQQRAMIFSGSSRFLVTFETLRTMLEQVHIMNESFGPILANLMGKGLIPGDPTATFANKSPCPA